MKTNLKKKLIAMIAIACMLTMTFASSVMAATSTIVINGTDNVSVENKTFYAYQIFTATRSEKIGDDGQVEIDDEGNTVYTYSYTLNDEWEGYFKTLDGMSGLIGEDLSKKAVEYVSGLTEAAKVKEFAEALYTYAKANETDVAGTKSAAATLDTTNNKATFSGLTSGYYLVTDETNSATGSAISAVMLDTYFLDDTADVEITLKADVPTLEKKIIEGQTEQETNSAKIGDVVNYEIEATVPSMESYSTYKMVVKDTLSTGLTLLNGTTIDSTTYNIVVKKVAVVGGTETTLTAGSDYTLNTTSGDGSTFTITFNDLIAAGYAKGDKIIVTYSAQINENATMGNAGNENTADLIYSNDPNNESATTDTPDEITKTFVTKATIKKVDENDNALTGATFVLKDSSKTAIKTINTGSEFVFTDLEEGTYYLEETVAPDGYNKFEGDIKIVIDDGITDYVAEALSTTAAVWSFTVTDEAGNIINSTNTNGVLSFDVVNKAGTLFPETGGIGTTIFMVVGGALMLGAVALFALKKRANTK